MSGKLILVTGVTGFIAGHVVNQLLERGFRVRGTARSAKVKILRDTIDVPGLEFTEVDDVATSDITEALKGVYAVIHVASPMPGRGDVDETLSSAVEGTLNILRQVSAAKIEKIVITSSFAAVLDASLMPGFAGITLTDSQWGEVTREQVIAKAADPFYVYFASKILAEKAVWEFASEHSEIDIATILPGFVYGPFAKHFPFPAASGLGTNGFIYGLMCGTHPVQPPPFLVDVRDIAKAHILALDVPRKPLEEKRYIVNAGNYTWKEAAEHLNKVRPAVKTAAPDTFPALPGPASTLDNTRAKEVLKVGDYIPFETTIVDAVDSLLEAQKTWV